MAGSLFQVLNEYHSRTRAFWETDHHERGGVNS